MHPQRLEQAEPSGHVDTFARDNLPPRELWPRMDQSALGYPPRLNCATELLDRMAASGPERTCLISPGETWTYARLLEEANRIAHVLVEDLGVVAGNRVLLRAPNTPMMAACWFAVLKAGGICVATMPLLRPRELAYTIEKAQIRLALTDERFAEDLEAARANAPTLDRIVPFHADDGTGLDALMQDKPTTFTNADTAADDVAIIAFTSGTTGKAKGTVHFHSDILAICDLFPRSVLRAGPDDIFCGSPPFAFTFGLGGILLFPMRIGAAALLLEQAAPPQMLEAIQRHRPTVCFTSPTAYRAMLSKRDEYDLSSLRKCVSAGETLPRATFDAWYEATGIRIIDGIGSTEMLHIFISAPEDEIRPGSTGRAVPGYEARVVDAEGNEVPPATIGRLAVRGPTGCRYLADEERQRAYVENGWNVTGDAYTRDEDGYFWYQARNDDMIISGGYNIAGPEVENVLLEHPAVLECGVVGVPHAERGHIVKAFIVLKPDVTGDDALVAALQEHVKREIAPYKYPRSIEFCDALPRTETGKLQRFRLRDAT